MPCQSAFLLSALRSYAAPVFMTYACAQFRSTPEYGHIAKAIRAFISFLQSDLRRLFFGTCLALLQGPVFAEVFQVAARTGQARLRAWIQETRRHADLEY